MPIFGNLILKKTKPLKHTNSSFTDIWWKIFFRKWNTCLNKKRDLRKNMFWEERKPLIINTPFEDVFLFFRKWFSFSAPNRHLRNFFKDVYTKKKSYIPNYQPTNKKRIFENEFSRKPSHKRTKCKLCKPYPRFYWKVFPHGLSFVKSSYSYKIPSKSSPYIPPHLRKMKVYFP